MTTAKPADRKRLLSISTLYPNSANPNFGNFVEHTLEALARHEDWDVVVVNPVGIPPLARGRYGDRKSTLISAHEHGLDVHRVGFGMIPLIGARRNARSIAKAVLPLVRKMHAAHPFDLIDAQFFFPDGSAAALIAVELGIPFAITARGSDIHYWTEKPWARRQIIAAGMQADGLVAVSPAMANDLERLGMERGKMLVHLTGIDHHLFRPHDRASSRRWLAQEFGLAEDGALLASLGALIKLKGQDYLIRALARLPGKRALLIGDGPERKRLLSLAIGLGVEDRVHFMGRTPHADLPQILSAADAMVLPSEREGLANAWIEALACGTPLVITDVGGAAEVVSGPAAGRLVERTEQGVAQGVLDLLRSAPTQHETAATANRFSWENNARALSDFYRGLAQA
ncbi:glycosyltransferase [Altererythrobacter sp.]|nr:glycosyltransferase [Altererythrobacter sp.]